MTTHASPPSAGGTGGGVGKAEACSLQNSNNAVQRDPACGGKGRAGKVAEGERERKEVGEKG